jgi:teichuronic acid biosynthesis glycosyltransferase TuaG
MKTAPLHLKYISPDNAMLVSVVIPAFNQAAYLKEALASVLVQTHRELEILVVDDGSTDDTFAVCEAMNDGRLRYVSQANDGTGGIGARNHAMLLAHGEWIALLDQDDRWAPDKLEKQLRRAEQVPEAAAIFCRVRFMDGAGHITGEQQSSLPEGDVFHSLLAKNRYYSVSGMFRRELLPVIGLPHAWSGLGDHALWLTVARHAPVAAVDEILADYRIHEQGYQESQRRNGLLRFARDCWRLTMFESALLHENCRLCRKEHARARRGVAKSYLRAVRVQWRARQYDGSFAALRCALMISPGWILQPWNLLQHAVQLTVAAIMGLMRPLR